ncbi:MAG: calcium-binding protein [Geminicoccaceae bacterium]
MTIIVAPATLFQPGTTVTEDVYGDSDGAIVNTALGQTFIFTADGVTATGDALAIDGTGRGGNDQFTVTGVVGSANNIFGDAATLNDSAQGGDDKITAAGGDQFYVIGDAGEEMHGGSQGGNDRIDVGPGGVAIGDGFFMYDSSQGGDDRLTVRAGGWGLGDAGFLFDGSRGGDDQLTGIGKNVTLVGDAKDLGVDAQGGNDRLVARGPGSLVYGDAQETMGGHGGDDYLHCQGRNSLLVGDGGDMYGEAKGGNDELSGSRFADTIVGDGLGMNDDSSGGDDVLLGGKGNDTLWGDALGGGLDDARVGDDRFVFGGSGGKDTIGDFQQGHDVIDVQRIGYTGIGQLTITDDGTDSVVHFHGSNQVTVLGVTGLNAADFLFA